MNYKMTFTIVKIWFPIRETLKKYGFVLKAFLHFHEIELRRKHYPECF